MTTYRNRVLLLIGLLLLPTRPVHAAEPAAHFVTVGVDRYANVRGLNGCVNDARDLADELRRQKGRLFGEVDGEVLLNDQATRDSIKRSIAQLRSRGKPGDYAILILSGHGDRFAGQFSFLPYDFDPTNPAQTVLSDPELRAAIEDLMNQDRKVLVLIDACFSGQFRHSCRNLLMRDPQQTKGGLVLMLSSMPDQTSLALGRNSAFTWAVKEAISGHADLNRDGTITLREVRQYAFHRTAELTKVRIRLPGLAPAEQFGECEASQSISDSFVLARVKGDPPALQSPNNAGDQPNANPQPPAALNPKLLEGTWELDPRDRLIRGSDMVIGILPDGIYSIIVNDKQTTTGRFRMREGNQLDLIYDSGVDTVTVSTGPGKLTLNFQGIEWRFVRKKQ